MHRRAAGASWWSGGGRGAGVGVAPAGATALALTLALVLPACRAERAVRANGGAGALPAPVTTAPPTTPSPTLRPTVFSPSTAPPPLTQALRLGEGGIGTSRFGEAADVVLQQIGGLLGQDDDDTGWVAGKTSYGTCPTPHERFVRWGWLLLVFADTSPYGAGRPHFAGWRYGPVVSPDSLYPDGLSMASGLSPGVLLGDLRKVYGAGVDVDPEGAPPGLRFHVGTSFGGLVAGRSDGDQITALEAGLVCR